MMKPRYQDIPSAQIPVVKNADNSVQVKVIAGESMGTSAVIDTRTPITYLHFTIKPHAKFEQKLPETYNAMAYVISGSGRFGQFEETPPSTANNEALTASADQLVIFQ